MKHYVSEAGSASVFRQRRA